MKDSKDEDGTFDNKTSFYVFLKPRENDLSRRLSHLNSQGLFAKLPNAFSSFLQSQTERLTKKKKGKRTYKDFSSNLSPGIWVQVRPTATHSKLPRVSFTFEFRRRCMANRQMTFLGDIPGARFSSTWVYNDYQPIAEI